LASTFADRANIIELEKKTLFSVWVLKNEELMLVSGIGFHTIP
jgi:hypothetical protein